MNISVTWQICIRQIVLVQTLISYQQILKASEKSAGWFYIIITPILKSLMVPVIWLALIGAIYWRIAPFFALNRIIFPANEEATLKTKQPIRFQGLCSGAITKTS